MLTQKDLYDYINKHGIEAYDQMAADLASNLNKAKAQYEADQKVKAEKAALEAKKVDALSDMFRDWWTPEEIHPLGYDSLAKTIYEAVDSFTKTKDVLLKHAKNVKTETKEVPGGTKTVTKAEIDPEDFDKAIHGLLDSFGDIFKW